MTTEQPPVYLALDVWMALGLDSRAFDAFYERNGWADTWSILLDAVREDNVPKCGAMTDEGPCVLYRHNIGPHMVGDDVGRSEPLPERGVA
jgi:hypothetical protein